MKKAILILLIIFTTCLVILFSGNANYTREINEMKDAVAIGSYKSAYLKSDNIKPKTPEDEKLLEKIKVLGNLSLKFELYEENRNATSSAIEPDLYKALQILLEGYEDCLKYEDRAKELEMVDEFYEIKRKFVFASNETFKLQERKMLEIISLDPNEKDESILVFSDIGKKVVEELKIEQGIKQMELDYKKDNPLVFENTKFEKEGKYVTYTGYVKNNSNLTYTFVEIKVVYYDKNKQVLDTDWTYAVGKEGLAPDERKHFKIMTSYTEGISSAEVSILDYDF